VNAGRIKALLGKEFAETRRNRAALLPVLLTALVCLIVPFGVALVTPIVAGEPLSSDPSMRDFVREHPDISTVVPRNGPEAGVQVFLFQQFLLMLLLIPVTGSMAFASYSVIGEKQNRTLEPLLATPLTTAELLLAKTVAALAPSLAIMVATSVLFFGGIAFLAAPGVLAAMLTPRTAAVLFALGPLASLVALQLAVVVSSRVNDPRTAQQVGVLIILPITGLMVAQFSGAFVLTIPVVGTICLVLIAISIALTIIGAVVFDREAILTRLE
jgi:ABC-2 type transport system permease protein